MKYVPRGSIHSGYRPRPPTVGYRPRPISVVRRTPKATPEEIAEEAARIEYAQEIERRLDELRDLYLDWIEGDETLLDLLHAMMARGLCVKLSPWG